MTLKETLANIPEDEYVYIGAKNGSSWLYIAKRKELEEKLNELNNGQKEAKQKRLDSTTETLNGMNQLIVEQNKIIDHQTDIIKKAFETISKACSRIAYITGDFEKLRKNQIYLTDYLNNWQDMEDREVIDSYPHSDISPRGTALLIAGDEAGKYWTLEELEQDKKGGFVEDDDFESETE